MTPLSVVIISHQNPEYLRLCLQSATTFQTNPDNQIIVVLDGPNDASEQMIADQFPTVDVIAFPENRGQSIAHNTGVTMAEHPWVLVVNDDNVFPPNWDVTLRAHQQSNHVYAPNQIEPAPSIFPSFIIKNFGSTADTFDINAYAEFAATFSDTTTLQDDGQTWPLYMEKRWFMILNGFDVSYPSPAVADWDLFLRAEMAGLVFKRIMACPFYHFASASVKKSADTLYRHRQHEQQSFMYFQWKWGYVPQRSLLNSAKPTSSDIRGITF